MSRSWRVGVVHPQPLIRRGIVGFLDDDGGFDVRFAVAGEPPFAEELDAAIVSQDAASRQPSDCPLVVLVDDARNGRLSVSRAHAALPVSASAEQLVAAVRAVIAGLHVDAPSPPAETNGHLSERSLEILRLLAAGATTRAISERLCYSERTIKGLIGEVETQLRAANRAQAVAEAIRLQLI
jgi:DNA-binding NarL/FixJ family response regulator